MTDTDHIVEEIRTEEQQDALYEGADETPEQQPTVSELQEEERKKDAEFPERMRQLNEMAQQKVAEHRAAAEGGDEGEDDTRPQYSARDLQDIQTLTSGARQVEVAEAQIQQADEQLTAHIRKVFADAGVQSFRDLRRADRNTAAQLQEAVQTLQARAQQVSAARQQVEQWTNNAKSNLQLRQINAERQKLFRDYPDLQSDDTRMAFLTHVAQTTGYTVEEIGNIGDAKIVRGLVKSFWPAFKEQRQTRSKNLTIRKSGKRGAKQPRPTGAIPSVLELSRSEAGRETKLGQQQELLDGMYGTGEEPVETPRPRQRRTPDTAEILYGQG